MRPGLYTQLSKELGEGLLSPYLTMLSISIDAKEAVKALESYAKDLPKAVSEAIDEVSEDVVEEARKVHRYRKRTGRLNSAIQSHTKGYSTKVFIDEARAPYGYYIHQGFKGWAPDPFLEQAFNRQTKDLDAEIAKVLGDLAKKKGL